MKAKIIGRTLEKDVSGVWISAPVFARVKDRILNERENREAQSNAHIFKWRKHPERLPK